MIKITMILSFFLVFVCAKPIETSNSVTIEPRIINGSQVASDDDMWKFIVSLKWDGQPYCGGSLVAPNWVLTAAHCLTDDKGNPYFPQAGDTVGIGSYNVNVMTTYKVKRFVVHPMFNRVIFDNDIALIELENNASSSTIPYDKGRSLAVNTQTRVAGWGNMSTTTDMYTDDLREALVPIVDFNQCNSAYDGELTNNMLCAGYFVSTRDSCQGDSGGPLIVDNTLVGIVSAGYGCAKSGYPGLYTKVQNYASWIKQYVPPAKKWVPIFLEDTMVIIPYQ